MLRVAWEKCTLLMYTLQTIQRYSCTNAHRSCSFHTHTGREVKYERKQSLIPLVHISEIEQAILPSPLDTTNRPASTGQMLSHRTTISAKSNKPNWRPTAASPSSLTLHLPPARAPTNEHSNQAISMQESSYECSTRSLEQEQRGYRRTP